MGKVRICRFAMILRYRTHPRRDKIPVAIRLTVPVLSPAVPVFFCCCGPLTRRVNESIIPLRSPIRSCAAMSADEIRLSILSCQPDQRRIAAECRRRGCLGRGRGVVLAAECSTPAQNLINGGKMFPQQADLPPRLPVNNAVTQGPSTRHLDASLGLARRGPRKPVSARSGRGPRTLRPIGLAATKRCNTTWSISTAVGWSPESARKSFRTTR